MFGFRPEGRRIHDVDPIVAITPYLMPQRCDAQVFLSHDADYEPLMRYIAEKYGKTHAFIGNADTRILLSGTPEEIRAEVKRCMDTGKSCPGFFLAVGNHIPANTPVENCLIYEEAYLEMCRRR